EPNENKELILSFSQELRSTAEPYRINLRGLPEVEALDIRAFVGRRRVDGAATRSSLGGSTVMHEVIEVHKRGWKPDIDFEVPLDGAGDAKLGGRRLGLRHDNLTVARLVPLPQAKPDPPSRLLVLFDTSASRALGFAAQVSRLAAVLRELAATAGAGLPLQVLAFDQEVVEVYRG